jgi:hypothetical protein
VRMSFSLELIRWRSGSIWFNSDVAVRHIQTSRPPPRGVSDSFASINSRNARGSTTFENSAINLR